jgi:hypothetical protein
MFLSNFICRSTIIIKLFLQILNVFEDSGPWLTWIDEFWARYGQAAKDAAGY